MTNSPIARRTLLRQTGFAIGGGLASSLAPVGAEIAMARAGASTDILSEGRVANKGEVKLAMYRKWPDDKGGRTDKPLPALFLVHGSSLSSMSSAMKNFLGEPAPVAS